MIPIRGDAAVGEGKLGFGEAGGEAFADHVMGAGVYALDLFVEVTISMTSRIKSSCWVLDSQLFGCQRFSRIKTLRNDPFLTRRHDS